MSIGLVVPSSRRGSSVPIVPLKQHHRGTSHGHAPHGHLRVLIFAPMEAFNRRSLAWSHFPPSTSVTQPLVFLLPLWSWCSRLSSWSVWPPFPVHHLHLDIHKHLKCHMSDTGPLTWTPYTAPSHKTRSYLGLWSPVLQQMLLALCQNCVLHALAIHSAPSWPMCPPRLPGLLYDETSWHVCTLPSHSPQSRQSHHSKSLSCFLSC